MVVQGPIRLGPPLSMALRLLGARHGPPWDHPHGECQAETAPPAPLRTTPLMVNRLNRDGGKAISIGSSTTHNQDLHRDLDNRQTKDMRTRIE